MQQLDPNKDMTTRFFKAISEDVDDLLDNTSSVADVECWIEERLKYAKNPKAKNKNLTKDPHVTVSSIGSQNYESINVDLDLTQESVDTEYIEENSNSDNEEELQFLDLGDCEIIDELHLQELEQIPHTIVTLTDGQVLEEFMLEEEIEFQDMAKCIVELPNKQELERCVLPEISVRIACDQEECMEEEVCDTLLLELPKLYKAQESVHKDEVQLETPKINAVEISALPREIKLEKPIEQSKSKLHTKWKKVLGSKVVRRANPTILVKREIHRPPPKPPDTLSDRLKASKRKVNPIRLAKKFYQCVGPLQHPLSC